MTSGTSSLLKGFFCLLTVLTGLGLQAQDYTSGVPDSTFNKDSVSEIRILIVPFNPAMYFSDADKDIGDVSQLPPGEVRRRMSANLENALSDQFGLYYNSKGISKTKDAADDLDLIFGSIQYAPKPANPQENSEEEKPAKSVLNGLKQKLKEGQKDTEKQKADESSIYMDVAFSDQRLLNYLGDKYETDYVIFVNQFEIITDYENCIDLQNRKYYREIRVHYSVYSRDGKRVGGQVIVMPYHSNENQISVIVRDNFGQISRQLMEQVYKQ